MQEMNQGLPGTKTAAAGLEAAVIGMAVRFPGAGNTHEFLEQLKNGVESIRFFSHEELEAAGVDAESLKNPYYVAARGYLQDADCFDAEFFGYTPAEAAVMDPQMRVFHQCAWEALEEAGYDPAGFDGLIGLYAGAALNATWQLLALMPGTARELDLFSVWQLINKDNLTTWVSYRLDLKGPSYVIQTACSTSLVAIHTAYQALLSGECHMALAGGVTVTYPRESGYIYREGMVSSPDGHCRPFDADAQGIVGGEGCAVVLLKLLEDALKDRDHIHAVIKGSAINNDGKQKTGYTAPSVKGQAGVIKAALKMAEVEPGSLGYIEAHGTATALGDPIEIEALKQAFNTGKQGFCGIGSVKSNFGHLDIAAGAASFVKTVLSLKEKAIFPTLHFKTPNPKIDFEHSPFFVPTGLCPWRNNGRPLRAGVSSFGIGGTNAHVVLEEAPQRAREQATLHALPSSGPYRLMVLSARTPSALQTLTANLARHLEENPGIDLADVAYTLQVGRRAFQYRKTAVCSSTGQAIAALSPAAPFAALSPAREKNRLIFLFPGFGGQAVDLEWGAELYRAEPVFRQALDRCLEIATPLLGADFKEIFDSFNRSYGSYESYKTDQSYTPAGPDRVEIAQPVLFIFEYALVQLLESWGIRPYAMMGYSMSEYVAAVVSGVCSLEEGLTLVAARVQLIGRLPGGAMLSVPLPAEQLLPLLQKEENRGVYLAIDNGSACIVSGAKGPVAAFESRLKKQLWLCMRLPGASYAAHSEAMTPILTEFAAAAGKITFHKPQIPYITNVTGQWLTGTEARDPQHWCRHLSGTVLFAGGIRELLKIPAALFIEVGPGRELTLMVRRLLKEQGTAHQDVLNLVQGPPGPRSPGKTQSPADSPAREPGRQFLLKRLGLLWERGVPIDWSGLYRVEQQYRVPLPTYPFELRRYRVNPGVFATWQRLFSGKPAEALPCTAPVSDPPIRVEPVEKIEFPSPGGPTAPGEAPENPVQEKLLKIWQRFFGNSRIGIRDDFFDLGGDSLKAMNVSHLVHRELGIEIPVAEFFQRQTIAGLAAYITEQAPSREFFSIKPVEKKDYYALSPGQKRLYFIQQMIPGSTAYNMPQFIPLNREIDREKLELIFQRLIRRHDSFRTTFIMIDGVPVQRINNEAEFEMEYILATKGTEDTEEIPNLEETGSHHSSFILHHSFTRPFDLSRAPLVRVRLVKTAEGKSTLLLDMHHLISDGTSLILLENETFALFDDLDLPGLRLQYKDYSEWKNSEVRKVSLKRQEAFWLKTFAGELPVLNLAADYPRPSLQSIEGAYVDFLLTRDETHTIKSIAEEADATLYIVLLAIYTILLARLSGQEDITVGTPISGRTHIDLRQIIGMFVNTLAMRNYPSEAKRFDEFLAEVKENTLAAYENQDYQFEDLVDNLSLARDISRNPVFAVMLNLLNQRDYTGPMPEIEESVENRYQHQESTSKFDLNLTATDLGEKILLNLEYSTRLFKAETIDKLIGYFKNIVSVLSRDRTVKLAAIDILTDREKEKILSLSWGTREPAEYDPGTAVTIQQWFAEQAGRAPDRVAVVFPGTGHLSYQELNERSAALARSMGVKGIKTGSIAAIMVKRSLEMITGILGILKAGAAYLPIDPGLPEERIQYMLADSNAGILLTADSFDSAACPSWNFTASPGLNICPQQTAFHLHLPSATSPVYIMYTSGSTGKPKGVILEHRSLVNLVKYQFNCTAIDFSKVLQFTTIGFDVSFQEIFSTLLAGGTLVLIDKETRDDIPRLFSTIEKTGVKTLFLPASYLKVVLNQENFIRLLPRDVRHIVTAGEQLIIGAEFKRHLRLNRVWLHNHYGPTESHVVTTLTLEPGAELPDLPSIGRPVSNTAIYIVNKAMNLVPPGVPGELVIGGIQVGRGYLNNPALTPEKFCLRRPGGLFSRKPPPWTPHKSFLLDQSPITNHQSPIYQTGDLARWLPDQQIEFLGRIDEQVKIRGFRVELGEIENRLLAHPHLKEAVVLAPKEEAGNRYLCAYYVPRRELTAADLREYLAGSLPDYMIPAYFMQLEKIPLNPNGKIDRKALPTPGLKPGKDYAAPRTDLEKKLVALWQEVLGPGLEIGIDEHFFALGGHSLNATIMAAKIHQLFKIRVPLAEIFRIPTVRGIARYITETRAIAKKPGQYLHLEPGERKDYYPLSSAQKRLVILERMGLSGTAYNLPAIMVVTGNPDKQRVEEVFRQLVRRHESLRTSFTMVAGEPVQRIAEKNHLLQMTDNHPVTAGKGQIKPIIKAFLRPFDLSCAPLLRVGLVKFEEEKHLLMVDMHHIVSDGTSLAILIREFMVLYSGIDNNPNKKFCGGPGGGFSKEPPGRRRQNLTLAPLRVQYRDYVQWQHGREEQQEIKKQQTYWLRQFPGEIPVLDLPGDFARPGLQSFAGSSFRFSLSEEETNALKPLALHRDITLFMLLLALYTVLLAKIASQEDIVVGTPSAGRNHADLQSMVGMFVNTLALRSQPGSSKTFIAFLKEIREISLNAFTHQEYPFEDLVEQVNVTRDTGRNPLFDTMFILQDVDSQAGEIPSLEIPDFRLQPYGEAESQTAKFDLTLSAGETDEGLVFILEYCTALFKAETIERFSRCFRQLITGVLKNREDPDLTISAIEILDPKEKHRVLIDFNRTESPFPVQHTLWELFAHQVEKAPDRVALVGSPIFSVPPVQPVQPVRPVSLTYGELNIKSHHLAQNLIQKGVLPDTIVGIIMNRSIEMVIGILGILTAGGAYLPLDPEYPEERTDYMLKDSSAKILLTAREIASLSSPSHLHLPPLVNAPATSLAYILYTSGTTGRPKGVAVNQAPVMNILFALQETYPCGETDRYLFKTSYVFDVAVTELFGWIPGGGGMVILEKDQEKDPGIIQKTVERNRVTHINFVPSMFHLFLDSLNKENLRQLAGLKYLFLAGEELPPAIAAQFLRLHTGIRLENIYGPTEGTVYASKYSLSAWQEGQRVPIGKPLQNIRLYILDKAGNTQPIGISGELSISGAGIARGYLNRPELTAERFCLRRPGGLFSRIPPPWPPRKSFFLDQSPITNHQSPIYQTGDLARWLPDGNIEFLGRIDRQFKIRGFRVEPGEIENHLSALPGVKHAAVVLKERDNDHYIAAYYVSDRVIADSRLRDLLSARLPAYMIPACFLQIEGIPLTPSGKVDRNRLPDPGIRVGQDSAAPRNDLERKLVKLWQEVLSIPGEIGIDDNFFQLGGHSLKAVRLAAKIHQALGRSLTLVEVFKAPCIRALAALINKKDTAHQDTYVPLEAVEKREYYRLTSAQKRLYILNALDKAGKPYNMPGVFMLAGKLDRDRLEFTLRQLIRRQTSFRCSFAMVADEPVQRVYDEVEFEIEYNEPGNRHKAIGNRQKAAGNREEGMPDAYCLMPEPYIKRFIRPFDLSQAPLLRVGLVDIDAKTHLLMVDMHHIAADGISLGIFVKEFMDRYQGQEPPLLRLGYEDYSTWQTGETQVRHIKKQEDYWLNRFAGETPILELPTDFNRPGVRSFEGTYRTIEIEADRTAALKSLASQADATLYMLLLSIFTVMLSKLGNQEDIIVGTPSAGRSHADLQQIIGMFVNTLALRNFPLGEKPFNTFLQEVKVNTLNAFANQDFPFETLIENLNLDRDPSRNPLFDVMFALQNLEIPTLEIPGLILEPYPFDTRTAKFDLAFTGFETGEKLVFTSEYSTRLFKPETLARFIHYFKAIISGVIHAPDKKIKDLQILSEEERQQLLMDFNDTLTEYPGDKTIPQLFSAQVEKTPERVALIGPELDLTGKEAAGESLNAFAEGHLTYRELEERSGQWARGILERGVLAETTVGIMMERSIEMIIGILGILKAGAAYLPIDPAYPEDRIDYMLKDSRAKILLTAKEIASFSRECVVTPEAFNNQPKGTSSHLHLPPLVNAPATSLAYIIYTSGSSGKPKGVMVGHGSVIRLVKNSNYITGQEGDRLLATGAAVFDIATFEVWWPLLKGLGLVIVPKEMIPDAEVLPGVLVKHKITILHLIPQLFNQLALQAPGLFAGLRYFLVGGDVVNPEYVNRVRNRYPLLKILHLYGPTENTTFSTFFPVTQDYQRAIPIGKPVSNTCVYILDRHGRLQPLGVAGELGVSGAGLARGYLNHPELTAERFDHDFWDYQDFHDRNNQTLLRGVQGGGFLEKSPPGRRRQKIYKTGDLAQWLSDGNLRFLGRMDSQVKIRGMRIELGEIQDRLLKHDLIKEAVVTARAGNNGEMQLCAYIVSGETLDFSALREFLAMGLPGYMIPVYWQQIDKIPVTPNGKVDTRALPDPGLGSGNGYTAPRNELEQELSRIWNDVLFTGDILDTNKKFCGGPGKHGGSFSKEPPGRRRHNSTTPSLGIDDNFFQWGGHSLKAAVLVSRIYRELGIKVPLVSILQNPTIRQLSAVIAGLPGWQETAAQGIPPSEEREYYPLSSNQQRLYILQRMQPESPAFNMPAVVEISHEVDRTAVETSLAHLIHRHESFRTAFKTVDDRPCQVIVKNVESPLQVVDLSRMEPAEREQKKTQLYTRVAGLPFDLARAPLLRVALVKVEPGHFQLMFNLHHIISDGWSQELLIDEFMQWYEGNLGGKTGENGMPGLAVRYRDFALWQHRQIQGPEGKFSLQAWKEKIGSGLPVLQLPVDGETSPEDNAGAAYRCRVRGELKDRLNRLAETNQTTLFTVMFSIYILFLYSVSGQTDIVCSIIAAGREHPELHPLIGFFVNSIVFKTRVEEQQGFKEFLPGVSRDVLEAFRHQSYPLEQVFEELGLRYPEIPVSFNMGNLGDTARTGILDSFEPVFLDTVQDVKFLLEVYATEYSNGIDLYWAYKKHCFKPGTMEYMAGEYLKQLAFFSRQPGDSFKDYLTAVKNRKTGRFKKKGRSTC